MPGREIPLVTSEFYHILNRGVAYQPIFYNQKDYQRCLDILFYYQHKNPPIKFSKFLTLSNEQRNSILESLYHKREVLADIISYCLMPNHFHIILKQLVDEGISRYIGKFTNSYTRYINSRVERVGPVLQGKFKATRIETEEQLLHVVRYVHLNPYTSYVVKNLKDLDNYQYSSLKEYLGSPDTNYCSKDIILHSFKNTLSYQEFISDQADYQRRLGSIKHLLLED